MSDFLVEDIGGRYVVLRGIGKMFYQDGFPIALSIQQWESKGFEVSLLHIADECLKNDWPPKTVLLRITEDLHDSIGVRTKDYIDLLEAFVYASYEEQREMLFQYLFGVSSEAAASETPKGASEFLIRKTTSWESGSAIE